jgi:hypothetical protein
MVVLDFMDSSRRGPRGQLYASGDSGHDRKHNFDQDDVEKCTELRFNDLHDWQRSASGVIMTPGRTHSSDNIPE